MNRLYGGGRNGGVNLIGSDQTTKHTWVWVGLSLDNAGPGCPIYYYSLLFAILKMVAIFLSFSNKKQTTIEVGLSGTFMYNIEHKMTKYILRVK